MTQKASQTLSTTWVAITDIITPEDDKNYFIQNRGPDMVIAVESAATPTTEAGICIPSYKTLKYVKGTDTLYLKSYRTSEINITDED